MSVQSAEFRTRLLGSADAIDSAEKIYGSLAPAGNLYQFPAGDQFGGWIDGAEMETLYSGTLARQESTARQYYDALRGSAPNDICPYCGQRTVDTLDHYLPKSIYPVLSVTPINLVPACAACNKTKLDFQPPRAEDQILHPYFDSVPNDIWLCASVKVVEGRPVLEYFANPPHTWSTLWAARVKTHLETLQLPALYASHAAEELVNNRESLQRLHASGGARAVQLHCLEEERLRRGVNLNSWQAAYYSALGGSAWFCSMGVLAIEASKIIWPVDPSDTIRALAAGTIAAI